MSVQAPNQIAGLTGLFGKSSQTVTFASQGEGSLRLGDIIRMKVMRQVGEQRYSMQFKGTECVVDSSIPFSAGDVLYGKVVGLGSQTEIERIRIERGSDGVDLLKSDSAVQVDIVPAKGQTPSFTRRLQIPLTSVEAREINMAARGDSTSELAMIAALALRNTGFSVSREMVRLVLSVVKKESGHGLFLLKRPESKEAFTSSLETTDIQKLSPTLQALELGSLLKKLVEEMPEGFPESERKFPATSDDAGRESANIGHNNVKQDAADSEDQTLDPMRWLFNAESGSCVTHRINTVPLLVNGRLIELNLSLFEEHFDRNSKSEGLNPRYQSIVLSLNTPVLGNLELRIGIYGKQLSIRMNSDNEEVAESFAAHSSLLRETLAACAWNVSEMSYRHGASDTDAAGHAVLMHLANLDRYELLV